MVVQADSLAWAERVLYTASYRATLEAFIRSCESCINAGVAINAGVSRLNNDDDFPKNNDEPTTPQSKGVFLTSVFHKCFSQVL